MNTNSESALRRQVERLNKRALYMFIMAALLITVAAVVVQYIPVIIPGASPDMLVISCFVAACLICAMGAFYSDVRMSLKSIGYSMDLWHIDHEGDFIRLSNAREMLATERQATDGGKNPRYVVSKLASALAEGINGTADARGLEIIVRHSNRIGDCSGQQLTIDIDHLLQRAKAATGGGQDHEDLLLEYIADAMTKHSSAVQEIARTLKLADTVNTGATAFTDLKKGGY